VLAILALLLGSAAHTILTIATEPSIEERAHSEAVRRATLICDSLVRGVADGAAELGQSVAGNDHVDVLTVDGTDRRRSPGVRVVFRVRVEMSRAVMAGRARTEVQVCFRQVVDAERGDFSRTLVPCPDNRPSGGEPGPGPDDPPSASPAPSSPAPGALPAGTPGPVR
jgi:hypothetical protein